MMPGGQQRSRAAGQQGSRAAGQQRSRAAAQQGSRAAEQQRSSAAVHKCHPRYLAALKTQKLSAGLLHSAARVSQPTTQLCSDAAGVSLLARPCPSRVQRARAAAVQAQPSLLPRQAVRRHTWGTADVLRRKNAPPCNSSSSGSTHMTPGTPRGGTMGRA